MANAQDWDDLRSDWVDEAPAGPDLDVDRVVHQVRRSKRRTRWAITAEVVLGILVLGWFAYELVTAPEFRIGLLLGGILIFAGLGATAWARIGPWPTQWETLDELARVAEQRARMAIRYARAGYAISVLAMVILLVIVVRDVWNGTPFRNAWVVVGCVVYVAVVVAITRWLELKRWAELEDAQRLRDALNGNPARTENDTES